MRVELDGGQIIDLGTTETSPTIGITDYSRRVTDDFGVTTVVERGFSRNMSVRLAVPFSGVDALERQLAELRATPAHWVADDRLRWLSARGFYKDFSLDLQVPPVSYCTLTIEGLATSETVVDSGADPAPDQPSTLVLLQPLPFTDNMLLASSVAETDYPQWAAGTTYASGARVIEIATHRIYESTISGNVGNDPAGTSGKWFEVGATNRWAMFDGALGSLSTASGSIAVTLAPGAVIDAVALLDVTGATVRLQAAGYDRTLGASTGSAIFTDLPATSGSIAVTVQGSGAVSVGTLMIGRLRGLGVTEAAPAAGITDYSRKTVDDFGAVTVVQRAWAKRMTARAVIRTDAVDVVANRIAAVRARPSLWIGQSGLDSLTICGFFKDFSIEVGENVSILSLSIEGLSAAAPLAPLTAATAWPDVTDPKGTKPADNANVGATVGGDLKLPGGAIAPADDVLNPVYDLSPAGEFGRTGYDGVREVLSKIDTAGLIDAATQEEVRDALNAAIAQAQFADANTLARVVEATQGVQDAALRALLVGDEAHRAAQAADASTREQITRRIVDGEAASITRETATTARLGATEAAIVTERTASLTREQAIAAALDVLHSAFENNVALVADELVALSDATGSLFSSVQGFAAVTARQGQSLDDVTAQALHALLDNDQATLRSLGDIAAAREEITGRLIQGELASAQARLQLLAQLAGNEASLESLRQVTVTQLASLSQDLETLTSSFGANTADTTSKLVALTTGQEALSGRIDDFRSEYNGNKGTVSSTLTSLANADEILSGRIDDFRSEYNGNKGSVSSSLVALATADQAVGGRIDNFQAEYNGNKGSVDSKLVAMTTGQETLTGRIDNFQSEYNGNKGSVDSKLVALTTGQETLTGRIDDFQSEYNGNKGTVSSTLTSLANADEILSGRIDDFDSEYNGNKASVHSSLTALADADEAISGRVDTFQTVLNGHTNTLTTYGQSINGLQSKWGAEIDQDGRITGFTLNGTPTRTDAVFVVDRFKIIKAGTPLSAAKTVFAVGDDGIVYILGKLVADSIETQMLKINGVTTDRIAPNAVHDVGNNVDFTGQTVSGLLDHFQTIASLTVTVGAGDLVLLIAGGTEQVTLTATSGIQSLISDMRIVRGSSTIVRTPYHFMTAGPPANDTTNGGSATGYGTYSIPDTDMPGAGTFTYSLQINVTNIGGVGNVEAHAVAQDGTFVAVILKATGAS